MNWDTIIRHYRLNFTRGGEAELDWFRRQKKNLDGAEYFERLYAKQISRAPLMAKYALFEKAGLQLAEKRNAEVLQTIQRLKNMPGNDALLSRRVGALETEIRKSR